MPLKQLNHFSPFYYCWGPRFCKLILCKETILALNQSNFVQNATLCFPWNFANKFALVHFFHLQKSFIDHSLSLILFFLWNTNFFLCQTFDFLPCFSWSKLIIIRIFVARDTLQFATDRSLHNNSEHWSLLGVCKRYCTQSMEVNLKNK